MAKHDALYRSARGDKHRRPLAWAASLAAMVCLATGGLFLWQHSMANPIAYRAPAGVVFLLLAAMLAAIAWRVARGEGAGLLFYQLHCGLTLRWLLTGPVVCYLAAVLFGRGPGGFYIFATAMAAWNTVVLCPLVWSPAVVETFTFWARGLWLGRAEMGVFALAMGMVVCEAGLRGFDFWIHGRPATAVAVHAVRLTPGASLSGRSVNRLGYWDDEFVPQRSADRLRVAVLGGPVTLSGDAESNCLVRIEQAVPGIELLHFGVAQGGPTEYSAEVLRDVLQMNPDVVLAFVSVGDDLQLADDCQTGFDWHALRLYYFSSARYAVGGGESLLMRAASDYESHLRRLEGSLTACRKPIQPAMERRWAEIFSSLNRVVRQCQKRGIGCGLVIVPSEFQVSPVLWQTLSRRRGYQPQQLDAELPQRQLMAFARARQVPVLNLLPHMRASETTPFEPQRGALNERGNAIVTQVLSGWLNTKYSSMLTELAAAGH